MKHTLLSLILLMFVFSQALAEENIIAEYEIFAQSEYDATLDIWGENKKATGKIVLASRGKHEYPIIYIDRFYSMESWLIIDAKVENSEGPIIRTTFYDIINKNQDKTRLVHYICDDGSQQIFIYKPKGMICYSIIQLKK